MSQRATQELARLIKTIGKFRMEGLARVSAVVAEAGLTQVKLGFRNAESPYSLPWTGLKLRTGQPLRKSGVLQRSFTTQVRSNGFVIGTNVAYAKTHQYGATIKPTGKARPEIKTKGRGKKKRYVPTGRTVTPKSLAWKVGSKWYFAKKVVVPQRQMVPEDRLGDKWNEAFSKAATKVVSKLVREAM